MRNEEMVTAWIDRARRKIEDGGITAEDLQELQHYVAGRTVVRQHLLYLHAVTPSIRSQVMGMALHEAIPGSVTEIRPEGQEWPYATVHDAILDGWQVIQFPFQQAPFDDREIDVLGYEFILQKLEEIGG
jgi:hypothetical protein